MSETPFNVDTVRELLFLIASEFETSDSGKLAKINKIIELQSNKINRTVWDSQADEGNALLVAHYLTVFNIIGLSDSLLKKQSGNKISEVKQIDKLKTEYRYSDNSNKNVPSEYLGSVYGLQFYALKQENTYIASGFCV